jgi:predicted nucleic acid-binding protein
MKVVVDTNVSIAANGRDTHASHTCQLNCVEFLESIISPSSRSKILLDATGLMLDEYQRHLNYHGQPGVGDVFFKYLYDHMYLDKKVQIVSITQISDENRGFNELPDNAVDKSDRMFLAVARKAGSAIVNAMDTDWHEQREFIAKLGVTIRQLCPEHGCAIEPI